MALTNHKHEVSTMGMCVRNHTMVVHQSVVHIIKHISECEWCTPHAHHIAIQFCTHKRMAPLHNIPKCDVSCLVVVVVVLSILWIWCLVVWYNWMVHYHHLMTK